MSAGIFIMEIKFLLPDRKTIVQSPFQIPDIKDENYLLGYLLHLKLFELNKKFLNKVEKLRLKYNISTEGIPYEEYKRLRRSWNRAKKTRTHKERQMIYMGKSIPIIGFDKLISNEVKVFLRKKIFNRYNLLSDIADIILFGMVYVEKSIYPIISHYQNGQIGGIPRVNISIFGTITRNQLDNYLDKEFKPIIEKEISKLPPIFPHLPTEEQFEIYFHRNKFGLNNTELASWFSERYQKKEYTYLNAGKTYSKAKESIKNLL